MTLRLAIRSYAYSLLRPLRTASGAWQQREGWLLRLTCAISGRVGWGENQEVRTTEMGSER